MHLFGTIICGDACSVTIIILGNGTGDPSSNRGRGYLHFCSL